jgi:hypothetical protein
MSLTTQSETRESTADPKRNITLALSAETLRKARIYAARRSTSISGLLRVKIKEMAEAEDIYERNKEKALALLHSGFGFDGIEHLTREDMHDRGSLR